MFQTIYAARALYPMGHPTDAEILATARKRAAQFDLSGFLLRTDQTFMGIIEGQEEVLDCMLARIRLDPRRKLVMTCGPYPVLRRMFPGWSMGYGPKSRDGFNDAVTTMSPGDLDPHLIVRCLMRAALAQVDDGGQPRVQPCRKSGWSRLDPAL